MTRAHSGAGPELLLMVGLHSAANCGDDALVTVALAALRASFPSDRIALSANDLDSYRGRADVVVGSFASGLGRAGGGLGLLRRVTALIWLPLVIAVAGLTRAIFGRAYVPPAFADHRDLLRAIADARLVFGCPGGYLYERHKAGTFLGVAFPFLVAALWGKPIVLLPQSIGPCAPGWQCRVLAWLLGHCRQIMVREGNSEQFVASLSGIDRGTLVRMPDLAFAYEGAGRDRAREVLSGAGVRVAPGALAVGMTLIQHEAQTGKAHVQARYERAIADALVEFGARADRPVHVILVPQCTGPSAAEDDRVVQRRFARDFPTVPNITVSVIDMPLPTELVWACIGSMDVMISTRMHSGIFALGQGVPVIAIAYLHKTPGIMADAGMADWVLDGSQLDSHALATQLGYAQGENYVLPTTARIAVAKLVSDIRERFPRALTGIVPQR